MSPMIPSITELVGDVRRAVRRENAIAIAAAVLACVPALLIAAWLLAGWSGWTSPSPAPLLLEAAVLAAAVGFAVFAVRQVSRRTSEREIARSAEAGSGLPAGSLVGVLELGRGVPAGTSAALARRAEQELGTRLAAKSRTAVRGEAGRTARRRLRGALTGLATASAAALALSLISPDRSRAGWPALTQPLAHLSGPVLPDLEVEPGDVEVPRGAEVEVTIRAMGRFAATLHHRAEGDVPRSETAAVAGDSAVFRFVVDARTEYWAAAPDGATSAHFTATPLDPLLVSDLAVEVRYPAYVGRLPERYETDVPPLEVPEGTVLAVAGRATRPLDEAALVAEGTVVRLERSGDRFAASWTPPASGLYEWRLSSGEAAGAATMPAPIDVTVVADAPPAVEITFPARDTILDGTRVQPIAADAIDDFGIAAATLVSWRITANGEKGAPVETPIPFDSTGSRVFVRGVLDARDIDLLPGDTLRYFVRVTDNSPRAQTAASASWAFYLPGRPELRDRAEEQIEKAVEDTRELARSAKELQDATRDLQRRTQANQARTEASRSGTSREGQAAQQGSLGFRESEQARDVLQQQEEMAARLDEMRQRLEAMQKDLEDAGLRDPGLEQELKELRELYDRMLSPELKQQMDDLRDALAKLDPAELQKALEELAARQQEIREQLQKSLEQLRRAAAEEQLNALAQEARELATQQAALSEAMKNAPAEPGQAEQQKQLESRARDLQASLEQLNRELERQQERQAAESGQEANQAIDRARQRMEDASEQAGKRSPGAAAQGEQAARELEQAAQSLEAARTAMAEGARQELDQAMQQAIRDAESIGRKQEELRQQMEKAQQDQGQQQQGQQQQGQQGQQSGGERMQQMREQQSALQQELNRLSQNLAQTSDQSGQVSREVGAQLGRANASMERTVQGMQQAGTEQGMPTQQAGQTVEALQRLAQAIQRNVQQIQQADPTSAAEQTRQQLSDIAQQQGQLNGRSSALLPMGLNPQNLAQQAERMAQDQRQIAERIEEVNEQGTAGKDEILGRLDEMAREAERLARELEGGRPPAEVLARQERLFHRLLDAGRTLEKEELSEQRVGERPGFWTPSTVKPLDPGLLDTGDRYRMPSAEELRALPPAYRRMVLEYFGRINRAATATGTSRNP